MLGGRALGRRSRDAPRGRRRRRFRGTDKRGGANGARIRLEPQQDWAVNEGVMATSIDRLEAVPRHAAASNVSLADLIVLAGSAAVEKAAADAGFE